MSKEINIEYNKKATISDLTIEDFLNVINQGEWKTRLDTFERALFDIRLQLEKLNKQNK